MMKALDRLLRETLRDRTANPVGPCLDAETVAGWFDHTLDARDRTAAEAHVADCVRCQALLAAMVRTAPPAVAHPWWRASFVRWLVPFAVTATAVLVWVNLPERQAVPPVASSTPEVLQPAERARTPTERESFDAAVPPRADPAPPPAPPASTSDANSRDAMRQRAARSGEARAEGDSSLARAKPEAASQAAAESVVVTEPARAPGAVAPGAPNPASARTLTARRETTIVSSDSSTEWRIAAAGTMLRSTDGGRTWERQATGVNATLTAGASPSPSVCWLVGENGVVLITTDGRSWQRLAFPEAIDLAAVRATDDRTATVTTTDGRSFTTSDRGQTWSVR